MPEPSIDLAAVLRLFEEFRDRIYEQSRGPHAVDDSLYAIVATKLFGFAFNTYKTIGMLLPEHYYEQASALYRTLWETGANFEWISKEPEDRSHLFLNFTLIEYRNLLNKRIRTARRNADANGLISLTDRLRDFEGAVPRELAEFQERDHKGKMRWRARFSGPTLERVIQDIGGEWLDEYDRDYLIGSAATHGAPGSILFPIHHDPELVKLWDLERSALVGVMSLHVMIRINRLWLNFTERNDEQYLADLFFRIRETATA